MDRETAKNIISSSLPQYLAQKGINLGRPFLCLNPEHVDHSPSMSYDRRRNRCHCFSCGIDADIFDIIQWDYNTSGFAEAFDIACDLFGLDIEKRERKEKPKIKPAKEIRYTKNADVKRAEPEVCDKVYNTLKKLSPLTEKDKKYLSEIRGLSEKRIKKDYFRLIIDDNERQKMTDKIEKLTGYSKDVIKYVPGFFVRKDTGKLDYCNEAGIGILIRNAEGLATAVQIRRDTAEKKKRYCWFTSIFAVDSPACDGGSTPGAQKDIMIPDNHKKCLCITEGRFKSEMLAANGNMVISIQGVSSWKGIDEIILKMREEHNIESIFMMFDSDIMGNRQIFNSISAMTIMLANKIPDLKIRFAVWGIKYGKGVDDCVLAGNIKHVKYVDAAQFISVCNNTFDMLLKKYNVASFKKMKSEDRKEFSKILQKENERALLNSKAKSNPKEAA